MHYIREYNIKLAKGGKKKKKKLLLFRWVRLNSSLNRKHTRARPEPESSPDPPKPFGSCRVGRVFGLGRLSLKYKRNGIGDHFLIGLG